MIVSADISDIKTLTEVALKSKAIWKYSNELIETWRKDLTFTSTIILECTVFKFLINDKIVGFYVLNPPQEKSIELEMLFVLPEFIGKGIGKKLWQHSFEKAIAFKVTSMTLLADPNAVPFYTKQGFYEIDKKQSSIPNRFLPLMQKDLKQ